MSKFLCIPKNENFILGGSYEDSEMDGILIFVGSCSNDTLKPG